MADDLEIRPGIAGIVLDIRGRVLLHHRPAGGGWAPPSGAVEPGESLLDALHRELREETTMTVTVRRLVAIYSDPTIQIVTSPDGRRRHYVTSVFVCDVAAGTLRGSVEGDRWEWFSPETPPSQLLPYARVWLEDAFAEQERVVVR